MSAPSSAHRSNLGEARRRLHDQGRAPAELLAPTLARRWQRCLDNGLSPDGRLAGQQHASAARLARALERQYELISHAQPVLEHLLPLVAGSGSVLLLSDAQGMVLQMHGDDHFAGRAQRVALRPGAPWGEADRGTNAIGTALAEGAPVAIHGAEHFLARNAFLSCCAAPILDPAGRMLGALNISGDRRAYQPVTLAHTLGLVDTAAGMIEHRLFNTWHGGGLRLRLHGQPQGLGTAHEGLLALAEDGRVIGANRHACRLLGLGLGLNGAGLGRLSLQRLPGLGGGLDLASLMAWAREDRPRQIELADGRRLWLKVEAPAAPAMPAAPARPAAPAPVSSPATGSPPTRPKLASPPQPMPDAAQACDALAELDSGDAQMRQLIQRARRVLGQPVAVLLLGETGVGKDRFARALHASGPRRDGPFVVLNCAALPETLIEAELFGHHGGAFTGARAEGAPGRLREADGGTLFLDEIGDMPLALQGRLLRVLQEREVVPLGGSRSVKLDFALVCATHQPLRERVQAGLFRADLYYRINGLTLQLPPLRQRSDLAQLVQQLLAECAPQRRLHLAPSLAQAFASHGWPGNLRQLHNALRTACALLPDDQDCITWPQLPDDLAAELQPLAARAAVVDPPTRHAPPAPAALPALLVRRTLDTCGGDLTEAARRLGVSRRTLYRWLRG